MDDASHRGQGPIRSLLRDPGFTGPVLGAFALAVALGVAYLSLAALGPGEIVPTLLAPETAPTEWGPTRPVSATSAAELQALRLESLLVFLGALTAVALATAGLTVLLLTLGRAGARRKSLALRTALGATRRTLARLLGGEALVLAGAGGLLGLAGGSIGGRALLASWPGPLAAEASGSAQGLVLALILTALGALFFVLVPLLAAPGEGPGLRRALASGSRTSGGRAERFLRNVLVVAQVGVSVALLSSAGLLLHQALPGSDDPVLERPEEVFTARVRPEGADGVSRDSLQRAAFYRALLEQARGLTTVEAESIASPGAWVGLGVRETAVAECGQCSLGGLPLPLSAPRVREHSVSPGYFDSLGIRVLEGRAIADGDGPGDTLVAVVSRRLARMPHTFQDGDPLGRQIQLGGLGGPWLTVVGVVEDVNPPGLGSGRRPPPAVYVSAYQLPPRQADLALRRSDPDADLEADLRAAVARAGGGGWIVEGFSSLDRVLNAYRRPVVWLGWALLGAGGFTFLLALHGLFAVTRYHVRLRRREIGIRMALGAEGARILRLVLGENLRLLAAGGVVGVWASLGLGGVLQDLGVAWFDARVTGAALLALLAAGMAGSWLPAREAASVEPARTLAEE